MHMLDTACCYEQLHHHCTKKSNASIDPIPQYQKSILPYSLYRYNKNSYIFLFLIHVLYIMKSLVKRIGIRLYIKIIIPDIYG